MRDIKKSIAGAKIQTDSQTDRAVLEDLLSKLAKAKEDTPTHYWSERRRIAMRSPIVKLAVAVFIVALVLGLVNLIDSDNTSGVVWADVVAKVQDSRGVIYRQWITDVNDTSTEVLDWETTYLTPTQYRSEGFREGKPWMSMFDNRETGKRVVLIHFKKEYVLADLRQSDEADQRHADFQNPAWWVQNLMSCEYAKLRAKEVDGVLCGGIETTDLAFASKDSPRIDRLVVRLWVNIETGYPVLFEGRFYGEKSFKTVFDQFQWNMELGPSVFEPPEIPEDYEQM
jgi:hypothetical protein